MPTPLSVSMAWYSNFSLNVIPEEVPTAATASAIVDGNNVVVVMIMMIMVIMDQEMMYS